MPFPTQPASYLNTACASHFRDDCPLNCDQWPGPDSVNLRGTTLRVFKNRILANTTASDLLSLHETTFERRKPEAKRMFHEKYVRSEYFSQQLLRQINSPFAAASNCRADHAKSIEAPTDEVFPSRKR